MNSQFFFSTPPFDTKRKAALRGIQEEVCPRGCSSYYWKKNQYGYECERCGYSKKVSRFPDSNWGQKDAAGKSGSFSGSTSMMYRDSPRPKTSINLINEKLSPFHGGGNRRRLWDGATVEKRTLVQQNIPVVGQRGKMNCGPACAEAVDKSFGGYMTQKDIRDILGGDPDNDSLTTYAVWEAYTNNTPHTFTHNVPTGRELVKVLSVMQNGGRVSINLRMPGTNVGHSVVMQKVVKKTVTKTNGDVSEKLSCYVMDPFEGGCIRKIEERSVTNAHRIFYIYP